MLVYINIENNNITNIKVKTYIKNLLMNSIKKKVYIHIFLSSITKNMQEHNPINK